MSDWICTQATNFRQANRAIPTLKSAIKELQGQVRELQAENERLRTEVQRLNGLLTQHLLTDKTRTQSLQAEVERLRNDWAVAALKRIMNPQTLFSTITDVRYYIKDELIKAKQWEQSDDSI